MWGFRRTPLSSDCRPVPKERLNLMKTREPNPSYLLKMSPLVEVAVNHQIPIGRCWGHFTLTDRAPSTNNTLWGRPLPRAGKTRSLLRTKEGIIALNRIRGFYNTSWQTNISKTSTGLFTSSSSNRSWACLKWRRTFSGGTQPCSWKSRQSSSNWNWRGESSSLNTPR